MADEFMAIPPELTVASSGLTEAGCEVDGARAQMSSERANDCAFSPGDMNSFWGQWAWVDGSLGVMSNRMKNLDTYLGHHAAGSIQAFDEA